MADYAPNYTGRVRIRYSTPTRHSAIWRYDAVTPSDAPSSVVLGKIRDVYAALAPLLTSGWKFESVEYAAENSDVFLPLEDFAVLTGMSATAETNTSSVVSLSFVGISTAGTRWRVFTYGLCPSSLPAPTTSGPGADFRWNAGEIQRIGTVLTALENAASGPTGERIVAPDNRQLIIRPYTNINQSSYHIRKLRRVG